MRIYGRWDSLKSVVPTNPKRGWLLLYIEKTMVVKHVKTMGEMEYSTHLKVEFENTTSNSYSYPIAVQHLILLFISANIPRIESYATPL